MLFVLTQSSYIDNSQLFHVLYLDAWALPCFSLVEWVQRCCTELLHAFLLDYLNGSIAQTTGRLTHTLVQGNCSFTVMGQEICQYGMQKRHFQLRGTFYEKWVRNCCNFIFDAKCMEKGRDFSCFVLPSTVEFSKSKCTNLCRFWSRVSNFSVGACPQPPWETGFPHFCSSLSPTPDT